MEVKRIGLDLAKNVFGLYGVDAREKRVLRKTVCRGKLLVIFAELTPCVAGMEAYGSAHYWALVLAPEGRAIETGPERRISDYAVASVEAPPSAEHTSVLNAAEGGGPPERRPGTGCHAEGR